jgi:hypothetical protein
MPRFATPAVRIAFYDNTCSPMNIRHVQRFATHWLHGLGLPAEVIVQVTGHKLQQVLDRLAYDYGNEPPTSGQWRVLEHLCASPYRHVPVDPGGSHIPFGKFRLWRCSWVPTDELLPAIGLMELGITFDLPRTKGQAVEMITVMKHAEPEDFRLALGLAEEAMTDIALARMPAPALEHRHPALAGAVM